MFNNPFDISKDGRSSLIDGIRYNLRQSQTIKEITLPYIKEIKFDTDKSRLEILEDILSLYGYSLNELTIADEHELLNNIQYTFDD